MRHTLVDGEELKAGDAQVGLGVRQAEEAVLDQDGRAVVLLRDLAVDGGGGEVAVVSVGVDLSGGHQDDAAAGLPVLPGRPVPLCKGTGTRLQDTSAQESAEFQQSGRLTFVWSMSYRAQHVRTIATCTSKRVTWLKE
jgi:hypothetical protein